MHSSGVLAAGWVPFVIVIVLVILFSTVYIKYYNSKRDSEASSTISAVLALSITLLTTALIPVDVFLVSYMKNSNGTFKDWAESNTTRAGVENFVEVGYYTMYGLITGCIFLLLPFFYFFYEEKDEQATIKSRCCTALKYTMVCLVLMFLLLLIGALVHTKKIDDHGQGNSTQSDWEKYVSMFVMESNWVENSLSLVISILSLIGLLLVITYTAYGMASWPIHLIKGHRNIDAERMSVRDRLAEHRESITTIRNKYRTGGQMTSRDASRIQNLEETEALMTRQDRHLQDRDHGCCAVCYKLLRPFALVFGILLILVVVLIFVSLLLTNIDKVLADGMGPKSGYILKSGTLPNFVDIILVFSQQAYPLDYVLFGALVLYLLLCTMTGMRNIGIWFFCVRMYRITAHRTRPQATLMMCMLLMFALLGINIIVYDLTPKYSTFGSQKYQKIENNITSVQDCSFHKDETVTDNCEMSRFSMLLTRFFYKMWFFGAAYYYGTWLFLLSILISFIVVTCKKSRSAIDGEVDLDDIVDSDEELIDG